MREMTLNDIKKSSLEVLCEIDKFCGDNNIFYCLACGTLIGAIRHNGFIPWDDDIDVVMPRKDYERFIREFKGNISKVSSVLTNDKHMFSYAKVFDTRTEKIELVNYNGCEHLGVDVDIFPLDYYYSSDKVMNSKIKKWKRNKFLWQMSISKINHSSNLMKNFIKFLLRIMTKNRTNALAKKIDDNSKKESKKSTVCGYLGMNCISDKPLKLEIDWFKDRLLWEFENYRFYIPVGYDDFLRYMYGDYMQLPQKEKQVTHHSYKAYWKD